MNEEGKKDSRLIPHSMEAEQAVLGSILLNNSAFDTVIDKLNTEDFYRQEHKLIFKAMQDLMARNAPVDHLTLAEELRQQGVLDSTGGVLYLVQLHDNTPKVLNTAFYADIVSEQSALRQLIQAANDIASIAFNPAGRNSNELIDEAEQKIFNIGDQRTKQGDVKTLDDLLTEAIDRIRKLHESRTTITGLATGFTDLDELTTGLQPADLAIVAGRPSMGKTSFALNIAEYAVLQDPPGPVLFFSLEMPAILLAIRLLASMGRINQQRIRTGQLNEDDWNSLTSAFSILENHPFFINDASTLTPTDVRSCARRVVREHGQIRLIVVDYLQLMQGDRNFENNRVAEISDISRNLKSLAKEMNCPVIALSQLNRGVESRQNKRPMMSDLRESGAIEQDADLIMFIYRDEVYNPESEDKGVAELIIGKQRNGPIGTCRLAFLPQLTRFESLSSDDPA